MNPRIQELLKQAGVTDNWNKADWYSMSPEMIEKFAQLIVQECVELVSVNRDLAIEDEWNVDEAMSTAINDIEEHFGVES
jgi:hypothetical protein